MKIELIYISAHPLIPFPTDTIIPCRLIFQLAKILKQIKHLGHISYYLNYRNDLLASPFVRGHNRPIPFYSFPFLLYHSVSDTLCLHLSDSSYFVTTLVFAIVSRLTLMFKTIRDDYLDYDDIIF